MGIKPSKVGAVEPLKNNGKFNLLNLSLLQGNVTNVSPEYVRNILTRPSYLS